MAELREVCEFRTTRLVVGAWDGSLASQRSDFVGPGDDASTTLLAVDSSSGSPVALLILFEQEPADADRTDLRIGYLVAEAERGRGLAGELVKGFIDWCRERAWIRSISGGVEPDNPASARVLTRNGFVQQASTPMKADEFRLQL